MKSDLFSICLVLAITTLLATVVQPFDSRMRATAGTSGTPSAQPRSMVVQPPDYKPRAASATSKKGKTLFAQRTCINCHITEGTGGCLGPPLDGVGGRRSETFIVSRISDDPQQIARFEKLYPSQELMPHPRVDPGEAHAIAAYLLTLENPTGGYIVQAHEPTAPTRQDQGRLETGSATGDGSSIARGRKHFQELGCAACHSIGDIGGQFAPPLDGVAQRRGRESIEAMISTGQLQVAGHVEEGRGARFMMPPVTIPDEQIDDITTFLMSLPAGAGK